MVHELALVRHVSHVPEDNVGIQRCRSNQAHFRYWQQICDKVIVNLVVLIFVCVFEHIALIVSGDGKILESSYIIGMNDLVTSCREKLVNS
jgi:hypothetical protein